jgi:hypothetical protein
MTFQQAGSLVSKALAAYLALRAALFLSTLIPAGLSNVMYGRSETVVAMVLNSLVFGGLILASLSLWFRPQRFAPDDSPLIPSPMDLRGLEGIIYRSLGILLILESLPELVREIFPLMRIGAVSIVSAFTDRYTIGGTILLVGGIMLYIMGNRADRRLPRNRHEHPIKNAANWLWNPPLDDEESAAEEPKSE